MSDERGTSGVAPRDGTSDDAYQAMLDRHPWIASRDPFAHLSDGWRGIVGTMLDAMDPIMAAWPGAMATNWYTKEKFGGLRVHFGIEGATEVDGLWRALRDVVDAAEAASLRTCEECGAPGDMRVKSGCHGVRCDAHSRRRRRTA